MAKSKLTWHFQSLPAWAARTAIASGVGWVKIMDPGSLNPLVGFPVKTIGRTYVEDGESNAMVAQGAAGADKWFARCLPQYERAPWVHAWEGPNEPGVSTHDSRLALVHFTRHWVELMHAPGLKTVALCLSVGWPDVGCASDLAGSLDDTDYWALHEYAAPQMWAQQTWLCLRYRRTVAELRQAASRTPAPAHAVAGAGVPPLFITECGIDGGVIGQPATGWKTHTHYNRTDYMGQLAWYDGELGLDDYVLAAM